MRSQPTFAEVENDLRSGQPEARRLAMQYLIVWTTKNPRGYSAALPLFELMLSTSSDPWILSYAARGIELIQGPSAARPAWLGLLQHPNDDIAAHAAITIDAQGYGQELLQMLKTRSNVGTQITAAQALARTKNPDFLSLILPYLDNPATRIEAIFALERLEDPRAIKNLEPLLQDRSDSGRTDDRGCPLQISQLAASATRRLQYVAGIEPPAGATPSAHHPSPPATTSTSAEKPDSSTKTRPAWLPLLPYLPLVIAIVEIPWVFLLIVSLLSAAQSGGRSPRLQTHAFDALALVLPVIGLLVALYVVVRRPTRRRAEAVCLWLGSAMCTLIGAPFAWELFR